VKDGAKTRPPHVQRPTGVVVGRGGRQTLTWTVVDTDRQVQLRLTNRRPDVAKLEGGETQVVTTSGGARNTVTIAVTGLSPGATAIEIVEIDGQRVDREAEIAAAFRAEMPRIAELLETQAAEIRVSTPRSNLPVTVSREHAVDMLDRVEAHVRAVLPYRELAPFHDAVAAMFEHARRQFDRPRGTAWRRDIILVQRRDHGRVEESWFRAVIGDLAGFFRNRGESDPADSVCFLTTPDSGATIIFSPPSFASDRTEVQTNSRKTLYLGRYEYTTSRLGYFVSTGTIDLLLDAQRVVECTLPRTTGAPHGCRPVSGTLERCP